MLPPDSLPPARRGRRLRYRDQGAPSGLARVSVVRRRDLLAVTVRAIVPPGSSLPGEIVVALEVGGRLACGEASLRRGR